MFAKNTCSNFVTPINRWYSTSRHIVYCFCRSRVSVTLSTKSTKFGSRYLVDRLSEVDEIWQIVSSEIAVHQCRDWWTSAQEILHGAPKYWSIKRNAFLVYIVWLSAMKFGSVRGLVNRHFDPRSSDTMRRRWCTYRERAWFSDSNINTVFNTGLTYGNLSLWAKRNSAFLVTARPSVARFRCDTNFARCKIHFTSKSCVPQILAVLRHGTPAAGVSQTAASYKERNYGTVADGATCILQGLSRWASLHRPTF